MASVHTSEDPLYALERLGDTPGPGVSGDSTLAWEELDAKLAGEEGVQKAVETYTLGNMFHTYVKTILLGFLLASVSAVPLGLVLLAPLTKKSLGDENDYVEMPILGAMFTITLLCANVTVTYAMALVVGKGKLHRLNGVVFVVYLVVLTVASQVIINLIGSDMFFYSIHLVFLGISAVHVITQIVTLAKHAGRPARRWVFFFGTLFIFMVTYATVAIPIFAQSNDVLHVVFRSFIHPMFSASAILFTKWAVGGAHTEGQVALVYFAQFMFALLGRLMISMNSTHTGVIVSCLLLKVGDFCMDLTMRVRKNAAVAILLHASQGRVELLLDETADDIFFMYDPAIEMSTIISSGLIVFIMRKHSLLYSIGNRVIDSSVEFVFMTMLFQFVVELFGTILLNCVLHRIGYNIRRAWNFRATWAVYPYEIIATFTESLVVLMFLQTLPSRFSCGSAGVCSCEYVSHEARCAMMS